MLDKLESDYKALELRIDDLRSYRDTTTGKSVGLNTVWALVLGFAGLIGTVLVIMAFFRK
jgi:hypothetical protein